LNLERKREKECKNCKTVWLLNDDGFFENGNKSKMKSGVELVKNVKDLLNEKIEVLKEYAISVSMFIFWKDLHLKKYR
jgi:hypothetical protein